MNATNRVLNRALLLLVGIIVALAGAAVILVTVRPSWAADTVDAAAQRTTGVLSELSGWTVELPFMGEVPGAVLLLLGAVLVLLTLLIVFIATRGGGKTATVLRADAEDGSTAVDHNVADAVLAAGLRDRPDVLSAHTSVYRVKRAPAIKLTVTTRRGAQLPRVLHAVDGKVAEWDALAGADVPVVLHLAGRSWSDRWRSATRVR